MRVSGWLLVTVVGVLWIGATPALAQQNRCGLFDGVLDGSTDEDSDGDWIPDCIDNCPVWSKNYIEPRAREDSEVQAACRW